MAKEGELELHFEVPSFFDLVGIHHDAKFLGLELLYWMPFLMAVIVGYGLVWMSKKATRRLERVPDPYQSFIEILVTGLKDFLHGLLGKQAPRYVPFLGSLFLFILLNNYSAILPGMHAATSKLSTTAALALIVFFVTQYEGVRAHGLKGYLGHFMGEPRWLFPIMLPIHLLGEVARPLSLSLRLFGNIMGEDTLVAVIVFLSVFVFSMIGIPIPLQFPAYLLAFLAGAIQALVFTLLSAVYIGGAVGAFDEGHGEEHGEGHGHGEHEAAGHGHAALPHGDAHAHAAAPAAGHAKAH